MATKTAKTVVYKCELPTANRGICEFIVCQDSKGFYAHELGDLTQWAKVFGGDERKAHRLNATRKTRNQYGTYFKPIPLPTLEQAIELCKVSAEQKIYRC